MSTLDFLVRHDDLHAHKFERDAELPGLGKGQILLHVERFAMTSNNITYAKLGHRLGYWSLFPTGQDGWGRIPAMGYGVVDQSHHEHVAVGDRYFGFFPMSRHLVLEPGEAEDGARLVASAEHRKDLAAGYNIYDRVVSGPEELEDRTLLLRGLFMTGFLIDDFLADQDDAVGTIVLTSASSKTAIGLAYMAAARDSVRVVGLTSPHNLAFTDRLGLYDEVYTYSDATNLDASAPTAYVDFAGNPEVTRAVHVHLGESVRHSVRVGGRTGTRPRMRSTISRAQLRSSSSRPRMARSARRRSGQGCWRRAWAGRGPGSSGTRRRGCTCCASAARRRSPSSTRRCSRGA